MMASIKLGTELEKEGGEETTSVLLLGVPEIEIIVCHRC